MAIIKLCNMTFYGYHGMAAAERETGRRYEVDCEITADISKAAKGDHLEDTINYLNIYHIIEEFLEKHRYNLIETLAERLKAEIMKQTGVQGVKLRVRKVHPPVPGNIDFVEIETED